MGSRLTTRVKIDQPEGVMVTMAHTMSLEDWKRLQNQLTTTKSTGTHYPSYQFIADIQEAVRAIEGVITVPVQEEDEDGS